MRGQALSFACAWALVLAATSPAFADDAAARQHFRTGIEHYDKKRYAEALDAFRAAYREKPSAIIKQNIALSYKGMGKPVEAAGAFDEALEEGRSTLAPETREAIERELGEIAKTIATLEIRVVAASDRQPIAGATITIDGVALPADASRRAIRLAPGIHVVGAHVSGYGDPPDKKLALLAGSPVDATFEMGAAIGTVTIRPSIPNCTIRIDGAEVGRGAWTGRLTAGTHRVEVTAPDYQTTAADVVVTGGTTLDYPIALRRPGDLPPPYEAPTRTPPAPMKRWYVAAMVSFGGENLQLSTVLGEPAGGTRRDFRGGSFGVRGGGRLSRFFAGELHGEIGSLSADYRLDGTTRDTETSLSHWQITPVLRFTTAGHIRFTTGTGVGVHSSTLTAKIPDGANTVTRRGSAVSASWLIDFGAQLDAGPLFLEGAVFFDVNGISGLRDDASGDRMVDTAAAARVGLRFGLGLPF